MERFVILGILVICFSASSFAQNNMIPTERYFESLPNRVYYTERSLITDTDYQYYFFEVDFRSEHNPVSQVFKISNTDLYGSLFEVNNFFYWVPKFGYQPDDLLKIELPGKYGMELTHNQQPLVSNQLDYNNLQKELQSFNYDMFLLDYYSNYTNEYTKNSLPGMLILSAMFGGVSYFAFTADTGSNIENIAAKGLGVVSVSLTVGGIVNIFRDRKRFKNYSNKRDEIIRKYN